MASSVEKPMPQTIEAYIRLAHRDLDLIMEMRKEIGQLKAKINKLEQKSNKKPKFISVNELIDGLTNTEDYNQ